MGKGKKTAATPFRSRIVGEGSEAPDQLLANPLNWRVHPKEQVDALEGLLSQVGWVQRVIVNKRTGHVVDGHARVALALRRNEPALPVLYVDLAEDEERLVLAAIDPIGGMAQTDQVQLDSLLAGLLTGDDGLDAFLAGLRSAPGEGSRDGLTDEDDVPPPGPAPVTQRGDVWCMGEHRLMCGDSTSQADVDRLMAGEKADMVWTDPPYNVAVDGKAGKILNDDMGDSQFREFLSKVFGCYFQAMRPGAVIYVAHAESERANFTQTFVGGGAEALPVPDLGEAERHPEPAGLQLAARADPLRLEGRRRPLLLRGLHPHLSHRRRHQPRPAQARRTAAAGAADA